MTQEFQLRVVQASVWLGESAYVVADVGGKGGAPHNGMGRGETMPGSMQSTIGFKGRKFGRARDSKRGGNPDAAGTGGGGIVGANGYRGRRDKFEQARGARGEIVPKPAEVVKGVMKARGETEATGVGLVKGGLEMAEQTSSPGQCQRHGAKFAQELVKCGEGEAPARGEDGRK